MVKVSVITPLWNQAGLTHNFLARNWQLYQSRPEVEFVVVDNGSTDHTPKILKHWIETMGDQLKVIELEKNIGFGPGNNRGATEAAGDILAFLSNDVIATGDYITPIQNAVQEGALFGPQLLDYDTGWNTFGGVTTPYLAGWCLFCTKATWGTLGGFDERFVPCDYEDIDLSFTAAKKDIDLVEVTLPLNHLFGQSARVLDGGRETVTLKNQERFKAKWNLK